MKIKASFFVVISFLLIGCDVSRPEKEIVSELLDLPESLNWVMVINPSGCKTCLDEFYEALSQVTIKGGAIVIITPHTKGLRALPLFQKSQVPIIFDKHKILIQEGLVDFLDQIILFYKDDKQKFSIQDHLNVLEELLKL